MQTLIIHPCLRAFIVKCGIILLTARFFQKHPSGGHSGPQMESSCFTRSCEVKRDGGMSINY